MPASELASESAGRHAGAVQRAGRSWTALGAGGVALAVLSLSAVMVAWVEAGPVPPAPLAGPAGAAAVGARGVGARGVLDPRQPVELAGSGSNLPLVRALAARFEAGAPGVPIEVHASIGSGGGLRALRDGAVHGALISRPASAEQQRGWRVVRLARVPVVLATRSPVAAAAGLSSGQLLALYAGRRAEFADGSPARVVLREAGDSAHLALASGLPGFAEVDAAARAVRRFPVVHSDAAMQRALLDSPHSVGLFDLGLIRSQGLPLHAVRIDGVAPSLEALRAGRYRFARELSLVVPRRPGARLAAFVDFLAGPEARAACLQLGYLPPAAGGQP